jgi:hypothetical protein
MQDATGLETYTKVLLRNPVTEELRSLSKKPTNMEHRKMAEKVKDAEATRDTAYAKAASLFREALVHIVKAYVKSEVFTFLMRTIIVMPNTFDKWTAPHFEDIVRINVSALTALQLCTEAYTSKPKAPFSLAKAHVSTTQGMKYVNLPVNSSVKRSMMAIAIGREAALQGSERRSQFFKRHMDSLYTSL